MHKSLMILVLPCILLGCGATGLTPDVAERQQEFIKRKQAEGCWVSYRYHRENAVIITCPNGTSIKVVTN